MSQQFYYITVLFESHEIGLRESATQIKECITFEKVYEKRKCIRRAFVKVEETAYHRREVAKSAKKFFEVRVRFILDASGRVPIAAWQ